MEAYEFTESENQIIGSLANRMKIASIMLFIGAIILTISAIPEFQADRIDIGMGVAAAGLIAIIRAIVFFRPTDNLMNIVNTQGHDVEELMTGVDELTTGFRLMVYLNIIAIISLGLGIVFLLI